MLNGIMVVPFSNTTSNGDIIKSAKGNHWGTRWAILDGQDGNIKERVVNRQCFIYLGFHMI